MNTIYKIYKPQNCTQNRKRKQEELEQKRQNKIAAIQVIVALALFAFVDWLFVIGLLGE